MFGCHAGTADVPCRGLKSWWISNKTLVMIVLRWIDIGVEDWEEMAPDA